MMFLERPQVKRSLNVVEAAKSVFHVAVETETWNQNEVNDNTTVSIQKQEELHSSWEESIPESEKFKLVRLSDEERNLQKYKFELITSEKTYLNSLEHVINNFKTNNSLSSFCKESDWMILFGNISYVHQCSLNFLNELNQHFSNDILLSKMYTILKDNAGKSEEHWLKYCRNITNSLKVLETLMKDVTWRQALSEVEHRNIKADTLHSGLQLPWQRVPKVILILQKILTMIPNVGSEEYKKCENALNYISQIAEKCNNVLSPEVIKGFPKSQEEVGVEFSYQVKKMKVWDDGERMVYPDESYAEGNVSSHQEDSDEEHLSKVLSIRSRPNRHIPESRCRAVRRMHSWNFHSTWQV